ncbi:maleylpyruvate isomerase N-terminal domain-containing protein [Actinoplanes nipponensis]|uniref:maleylpyruvate isomerase N-terminal domain-containing protein n=1 Tax=Actinoplanes nipponensis TaxID=135950 RepID=UPI0034DB54C8
MDILPAIADERRRVADLVESLHPEQLDTPSLCGEWTVREVAGHLLAAISKPVTPLLPLVARSGFNIHRAKRAACGADGRTTAGRACPRSAGQRGEPVPAADRRLSRAAHRPAGARPGHAAAAGPAARAAAGTAARVAGFPGGRPGRRFRPETAPGRAAFRGGGPGLGHGNGSAGDRSGGSVDAGDDGPRRGVDRVGRPGRADPAQPPGLTSAEPPSRAGPRGPFRIVVRDARSRAPRRAGKCQWPVLPSRHG